MMDQIPAHYRSATSSQVFDLDSIMECGL